MTTAPTASASPKTVNAVVIRSSGLFPAVELVKNLNKRASKIVSLSPLQETAFLSYSNHRRGNEAPEKNERLNMKLTTAQLVARLIYADSLCSWLNVHAEMKQAMAGLVRRGLAVRRESDEAFTVTDEGKELIAANKNLVSGGYHDNSGAYVHKTVAGAKYWTDQWQQQIPV